MNNIKKILLIGIIFFICGCSLFTKKEKKEITTNNDNSCRVTQPCHRL